ncbi:DUF3347 domain-containing protein [Mucilaginibacter sp. HMF5004]|uniref:DUF3347 domain-containing protein n=1 Tax=Mucilaginibacter rivuli TaxID=2857527 RepID=UPI001C5E51BC|nr:DUF3347 domain-containing protein [Mucilaginibacter rivuli]MBW4891702.1 DUF3347 domain-containing protein [Mucilaginibacter rivuli]
MRSLKISFVALILIFGSAYTQAQPVLPASNAIDKITNAYIGVKNALVESDGGQAQLRAKLLLKELSANPEQRLKPEQKVQWAAFADKLKFDTRHISETTVVAHQREHFGTLSKNMFAVLKKLKLNTLTVYEQYCPMKKQMWISETAAIRNPYYGKQMLECGTTRETL